MSTRRAVIAMTELDTRDRIQVDANLYTLTAKPRLVAGASRWQVETTTGVFEYFEDNVTIIVPSSRPHTTDEINAVHTYALDIHKVMDFQSATYNRNARTAFLNGWTELAKVPTDETGPTYWGYPDVGQFVLVPNAGGRHQSPGSYGYTRTEVLLVERNGAPKFGHTSRIKTRAFGSGCWTTGDYLICGTKPAQ